MEFVGFFGNARLVADGVLIADVVGDRAADFVHLVQGLGKKRDSAGAIGQDLQRLLGAFGMLLITQDANGVYRRAAFLLQLLHGLLQRVAAGVVFAVGHDEDDLFLQAGILFQVFSRRHNRVIESSPAAGIDLLQRFLQFQQVVGEVLIQVLLVVEVHDEYFVLR